MFPPLWETLIDTARPYRKCVVNGNEDFRNKNQDFDGDKVNDYDNICMTLISGAETIRIYLSVAALQAIKFKDIYGKTESQYILQLTPQHMNIGK